MVKLNMKAIVKLDNKKRISYRSSHDRYLFTLRLAKAWVSANPNVYFPIDNPIGVSVTLYDKKKQDPKYDEGEHNTADYDLGAFVKLLTEGLENIAYDKKRQIVEFSISKFLDKDQRVEFEVYEI